MTLAAVGCGAALLLVGALGASLETVVLLPSMGPTLVLQLRAPDAPSSQLRAAVLGHGCGIAAGAMAHNVVLPTMIGAAGWSGQEALALAAAASLALTVLLTGGLRAEHPPAAATTLIVALGLLPSTPAGLLSAGAALGACIVVGELGRRFDYKRVGVPPFMW